MGLNRPASETKTMHGKRLTSIEAAPDVGGVESLIKLTNRLCISKNQGSPRIDDRRETRDDGFSIRADGISVNLPKALGSKVSIRAIARALQIHHPPDK